MAAVGVGSLLGRAPASRIFSSPLWTTGLTHSIVQRALLALPISLSGVTLRIPTWGDIWESVLRAVPKNKTSHSKKRHRQMAGKALKDVNNLCKCPGCGSIKRTHRLCESCLTEMKEIWRGDEAEKRAATLP